MTEQFKGYMDEVRVTVGERKASLSSGEAKPAKKPASWRMRFSILWGAFKYLFTGKGVWLQGGLSMNIGTPGISAETWVKRNEQDDWEHWHVSFDGREAKGYTNGRQV